MRHATLTVDDGPPVDLLVADTVTTRMRGMLGRRPLPPALLLRPCSSVHGTGMHAPLDVAFLDRAGRVLDVIVLRPWAPPKGRRAAADVLEAPVGSFAAWGLVVGSVVRVDDAAHAGRPPA